MEVRLRQLSVPGACSHSSHPSYVGLKPRPCARSLCVRASSVDAVHCKDAQSPVQQASTQRPTCTFLEKLTIHNFALVSSETIDFQPGLNVISGASGSGKSVLLQALGVVLGMPVDKDMIRDQEINAVVEARFRLSGQERATACELLSSIGLPKQVHPDASRGELVIRREIQRKSSESSPISASAASSADEATQPVSVRSTVFINGAATPLRNARALGAALVDVNSQNAAAALRKPAAQLVLLDKLAHCAPLATEFARGIARLGEVKSKLEELREFEDEGDRDAEQAALDRIDRLGVEAGEEVALKAELARLDSRAAAVQLAAETHAAIGERTADSTLLALLDRVSRKVERLQIRIAEDREADGNSAGESDLPEAPPGALHGPAPISLLEEAASNLYQVRNNLEAAKDKLDGFVEALEKETEAYDRTKTRLQAITDVLVDTGCDSTEELLECAADIRHLLQNWDTTAEELAVLRAEEARLESALVDTATRLSTARRRASGHLRQAVEASLQRLAMQQSRFDVRIGWERAGSGRGSEQPAEGRLQSLYVGEEAQLQGEVPGKEYKVWPTGLDKVEFLLAAGPAEPLQPLRNVASGGESARVMLALKAAPSESPEAFSGFSLWDSGTPISPASEDAASPQPSTGDNRSSANEHQEGKENNLTAAQSSAAGNLTPSDDSTAPPMETAAAGQQPTSGSYTPDSSATTRASPSEMKTQASQQGVLMIDTPGGGISMFPWSGVRGGAAEFDGDTAAAERALAALASPVMVLDEVDAGTGARLGASVGQLLHCLAEQCGQVLCVTHVPQVAAYARRHVLVEKEMQDGRPFTGFRVLQNKEERLAEVAEMLGLDITVAQDVLDAASQDLETRRAE